MEELHERIEQYLNGELSEADAVAFRASIETDPDLAAEVELHRRLNDNFADPGEWKLRDSLSRIAADPPTSSSTGSSPLPPWAIGVLLLIGLATTAYFLRPGSAAETITPPALDTLDLKPSDTSNRVRDTISVSPPPPVPESREEAPSTPPVVATRDPAAPLPVLERLIDTLVNNVYDFELLAVRSTVGFSLTGTLFAFDLPSDSSFLLRVYDNRPTSYPDRPLFSDRLVPAEVAEEGNIAFGRRKAYAVEYARTIELPEGRLYYVITTGPEVAIAAAGRVE